MTTLLDYKTTLAYLAYLGFPETPQTSALLVTQPRKKDRKRGKVTRNVFLAYVCGAAGSGKTALLRAFVGKPYIKQYEPTTKMINVVNSVDINGSEKYLVVSIISRSNRPRFLMEHFSFKNLARDMNQRFFGRQRRRIWQTLLSMCMTRAIQTPSHTSVVYACVKLFR